MTETIDLLRLPWNVRQRLDALADVPNALQVLNASVAALETVANAQALQLGLALQAITSLQATSPVFLTGTYTIAQLPDPAANVGKYATVTDLWGDGTRDVVLAASSLVKTVRTAYWKPLRPASAQTQAVATGDLTLSPLVNAQVQFLTGAVAAGVTRQVSLGIARAWPGAMFEVAFDGTLGLGASLNVAGTGLGSLVAMVAGGRRRFVFDQGAWKQF